MKVMKCKNCNDGRKIYTKGPFTFWERAGCYCARQNKLTQPDGVCSHWNKKVPHYDVSVQRIDSVIEDVKFIIDNAES